jgi:hypothetical protein
MASYWIRPVKGCHAPRELVTVVPELTYAGSDSGNYTPLVATGFHAVAAHRVRDRWTPRTEHHFATGPELHDWLEEYSRPRRTTWIIAPIASETLTVSDFWSRIDSAGIVWDGEDVIGDNLDTGERDPAVYRLRALVLRGVPDIVRYTIAGKTLCWTSARQYLTADESELAKCLDLSPDDWEFPTPAAPKPVNGGLRRARLWHTAMRELIRWWLSVKGGPWGPTTGALAMSYFRARLAPQTVLSHDDSDVKELENRAIHGGRASVWYVGDVLTDESDRERPDAPPRSNYPPESGPLVQVDVKGMYPHLLQSQEYPTRLLTWRDDWRVRDLAELLADHGAIAQCTVCARQAEYPLRRPDGRIVYPLGLFQTTLTTPELAEAIARDELVSVQSAAIYSQSKPFEDCCSSLLAHREEFRGKGLSAWELFVKLLSNTLSGKTAERKGQWERRPEEPAELRWGEWIDSLGDDGKSKRFRALAGLVWERVEDAGGSRQMGAIYAQLTAMGRCKMRTVRERLPSRTVVAQDTDGLWLRSEALPALESLPGALGTTPGKLRPVLVVRTGRWWGPKHYWTEEGWVLSGYHEPVPFSAGLGFDDTFRLNPILGSPQCPPPLVMEHKRRTTLSLVPVDGVVHPNGWITPLVYRDFRDATRSPAV